MLFRENLSKNNLIEELLNKFENILVNSGFYAKSGQIVDASIISVPIRHAGKKDNELIKNDKKPKNWDKWSKSKKSQTDMDARWSVLRSVYVACT